MTLNSLEEFPAEILFHILSYLDLPDLASLATLSKKLHGFAIDPTLHRIRLLVVTPSRINHFLSEKGISIRPSIPDLVHRGIMCGLFVERKWRANAYLYSPQSVRQYENSKQVARVYICHVLGRLLARRESLNKEQGERETQRLSPALLPIVHRLKWSLQRDRVSQHMRSKYRRPLTEWIEQLSPRVLPGDEWVRLAVCPGVRRVVKYFELLG